MILRGPPAPPARHPTLAHALARRGAPPVRRHLRRPPRARGLPPVARGPGPRRARRRGARRASGSRPATGWPSCCGPSPPSSTPSSAPGSPGAVPVPLYPPVRLGRMDEYAAATARMLAVSGARLVVSGRRDAPAARRRGRARRARRSAAATRASSPGSAARLSRDVAPEALGLVQFSSGSTVDPKPVALTHAALAAQADALVAATAPGPADVLVSWLPLYHDMGLIGALLGAMSYPGPLVLIPPEHFLARPALWLRAIARHRGTISAAPSFAYAVRGGAGARRGPRGPLARELAARARRRRAGLGRGHAPLRRPLRAARASTPARSSRSTASPRRRSR